MLSTVTTTTQHKKAELTLGLVRDRAATWRLILNNNHHSAQESRADTGVSTRQSRHLAINFE